LLAEYLDMLGVLWLHPPNEGRFKPQYLAKRKKLGVKAGAPDVLIFTPPPVFEGHPKLFVGAAIELKRARGAGRLGRASAPQRLWLEHLERLGWAVAVCHGFNEAKAQLDAWGYRAGMR
jgi:hypothetical protein